MIDLSTCPTCSETCELENVKSSFLPRTVLLGWDSLMIFCSWYFCEITKNQTFVDLFNELSQYIARMQSANVTSQVEHQQRREAKNWPFLLADYVAILGEKSVRFDRLKDRLLFCLHVKNHKHVAGNYAYFSLLFMEIFCDPPCFLCHKSHVQLARKLPGYVISGLIAFRITR